MKKRLACFLGFHRWYLDSSIASYGYRCDKCGRWQDKERGQQVEQERRFIAENKNIPMDEIVRILRNTS